MIKLDSSTFDRYGYILTFSSLVILALFVFMSIAVTALSHILIILPCLYFAYDAYKTGDFLDSTSSKFLAGLIIVSILSVVFNTDIIDKPWKNIFKLKYFLIGLLSVYAYRKVATNFLTKKKINFLLVAFLISVTLASVSGYIGFLTGFNPLKFSPACHPERVCGMFGNLMTYAHGMAFFLSLLVTSLAFQKKIKEFISPKILWIVLPLNLLAFYFALTRGAMLGFLVSLPFILFYSSKKLFIPLLLCGSVFLGLIMYVVLTGTVLDGYRFNSSNHNDRLAQYHVGASMIKERPVLGVGFRNFEAQTLRIKKKYNLTKSKFSGHAHNNFLEFLGGTGILGFLMYLGFILFWFIEMARRKDIIARLTLTFLACFIVSGMFQSSIIDGENTFFIMALYAISQIKKKFEVERVGVDE